MAPDDANIGLKRGSGTSTTPKAATPPRQRRRRRFFGNGRRGRVTPADFCELGVTCPRRFGLRAISEQRRSHMRYGWWLAQVSVSPNASGMPGAQLVQRLLDWCQMGALWGSLAALLGGAALYGWSRESGNYGGASRGRNLALGGAVGAALAGVAPAVVNLLFRAARS